MKLGLSLALLPLLLSSASAGWFSPQSQQDTTVKSPPAAFEGSHTKKPSPAAEDGILSKLPRLDLESLLTSGPIARVLAKTGVNITEKFEKAKQDAANTGWHPEIPIITDQNFRETIVEEKLTRDELEKRVWILIVTVPNADPLTKFVDEKFDAAYNLSRSSQDTDLQDVKWGRINYMDVTEITTRWWIWKAPMLVICRKGGQEMRFYHPQQLRLVPELLYHFLKEETWRETKPWSGPLAPGGSLEPTLGRVATFWAQTYVFILRIPKWVMLLGTGALASILLKLMHRSSSANPSHHNNGRRARIASSAKKEDGGIPVKTLADKVVEKERGMTRQRSLSPSTRASARIAARRSESPVGKRD